MNEAEQTTTQTAAPVAAPASRSKEGAGVLKRSSRWFVDPALIAIDPDWNNRIDFGDMDGLASSIKHQLEADPDSGGLIEDIGVRRLAKDDPMRFTPNPLDVKGQEKEKEFVVVYGHRRTNGVWSLMQKGTKFPIGIPAKLIDKAQDLRQSMISMLAENVGQKPLTPLEEAAGYKKLRDGIPSQGIKPMTLKEICVAVGRAVPHVTEMLALLEADDDVKEAVATGAIGKQMAKHIASRAKGDKAKQKELVAKAKAAAGKKGAKGAVMREAEDAKRAKSGKAPKIRALSNAQLSELGAKCAKQLAGKMKDAGKEPKFDLRKWVSEDDKLALAAAFGALEALKAAAGQKIDLDF